MQQNNIISGNHRTSNLLNEANDSKFVTRKWNIAHDQSNGNYDVGNEIIYNKEDLKSNLRNYNDACVLVRDNITIPGRKIATEEALKNCAPFTKCITKNDVTTIDDAEDLDLVMPMHNLTEHSSKYSETTGIL